MGKFVYALMLVFAIEFALFAFGGTTYSPTSVFAMIYDPGSLWTNPLYLALVAAISISIASAIIPGNLWNINQIGVYATIATVLITFTGSIVHLGTFINGSLTDVGISSAKTITAIIVAPFVIGYAWAAIEWMRWN